MQQLRKSLSPRQCSTESERRSAVETRRRAKPACTRSTDLVGSHSHKKASRSVCSDTRSAHLLACALRQLQWPQPVLAHKSDESQSHNIEAYASSNHTSKCFLPGEYQKARLVQLYQQHMYHLCTSLTAGFWVKCLVESMKEPKAHQPQQYVGGSEGCCAAALDLHRLCLCNQHDFQTVSPCASQKRISSNLCNQA